MKKRIFVVAVCASVLCWLLRQKTRRLLHQRARRFQTAVSGAQDLS